MISWRKREKSRTPKYTKETKQKASMRMKELNKLYRAVLAKNFHRSGTQSYEKCVLILWMLPYAYRIMIRFII